MQTLGVAQKFLIVIAAFGLVSFLVALHASRQLQTVTSEYRALLDGDSDAALSISRAGRALQGMRAAISDLMMARSENANTAAMEKLDNQRAEFTAFMQDAEAALPETVEVAQIKADALQVVEGACRRPIEMAAAATSSLAIEESQRVYLLECAPAFRKLTPQFSAVVTSFQERAASRVAELQTLSDRTVMGTLVASGLAVIGALIAGFLAVRRWIVRPLLRLADAMGKLATGHLDLRIEGADRRDELGMMTRAVAVFRDNAMKVQEAEAAKEQVAALEQARAARMTEATAGLAGGLRRMAQGDLSVMLTHPYAAEFEPLRTDFNAVARSLCEAMSKVATTATRIEDGSRGIRDGARELSKRNEGQAASVEEQSAALSQIASNVRDTSERSEEAKREAEKAAKFAETSETVVGSAFSAMQRIETSSREITAISGLIDEISFQTNLLALNASVEAARAGDAGRGFAVVAQEVRELAQRSARAAQEIKDLIRKSVDEVEGGVKQVLSAGEALKQIGRQVRTVDGKLDDITRSAREQVTALAEISAAVSMTDRSTQQNAAMSEETLAAASSLAQDAETLRRLLATFVLDAEAGQGQSETPPARRAVALTSRV